MHSVPAFLGKSTSFPEGSVGKGSRLSHLFLFLASQISSSISRQMGFSSSCLQKCSETAQRDDALKSWQWHHRSLGGRWALSALSLVISCSFALDSFTFSLQLASLKASPRQYHCSCHRRVEPSFSMMSSHTITCACATRRLPPLGSTSK